MRESELVAAQVHAFSAIERACSALSLLGCLLIISTFCLLAAFHKPINRIIFYASLGNLMTNIATIMARTYLEDTSSVGCQTQAFLIQMFMPADTFWALAMAANVYLTFYQRFDARRLRRMEVPYITCCYGIPFVVALTLLFISTPSKGRMYGNATLWCWIGARWDVYRIALFYGPIWLVTLGIFFIYIRAGRDLYENRRQLHHYQSSGCQQGPESSIRTTEVLVTSEAADANRAGLSSLERQGSGASQVSTMPSLAYSVSVSAGRSPDNAGGAPCGAPPRRASCEINKAARSYAKCAILFFSAMLVTWIPSSANRVYSVVHPGEISLPLVYMGAVVLPLQGFWNAVIYVTMSWEACRITWQDWAQGRRAQPAPRVQALTSSFRGVGGGLGVFGSHRLAGVRAAETESVAGASITGFASSPRSS